MENITVNMENLTEEERKQLLALVEKGNKPKSKVWKPKNGEEYFYVSMYGTVSRNLWANVRVNDKIYNFGNCYRTEEEAEFALEKRKVEVELKRFTDEHNDGEIDWNSGETKYYMAYDTALRKINIHRVVTMKESTVYFTSEKIANQAVKEIGEERLKKYYFEAKMN